MEMTGDELNRALRLVDWATSEEELANLDVSTTGWPEAHIVLLQEAIDKHRQMLVAPPLE